MNENEQYIDEISLSKISTLSASEIQSSVLKAYEAQNQTWIIDESLYVECPIYIKVDSLPPIVQQEMYKGLAKKKSLLRDGVQIDQDPRFICLILRIKWKYESFLNDSDIDREIESLSRNKSEATYKSAIFMLFNFIDLLKCGEKVKLQLIFEAVLTLGIPGFNNTKYLFRKYKVFKDNEYSPVVFFSNSRNQAKNHLKKILEIHKLKINELRRTHNSSAEIASELKEYCEKNGINTISRSTVKKLLAEVYDKNRYAIITKGRAFVEDNLMGHLDREKPKFKFQVMEADGSRLEIPYKVVNDKNWKVGFLKIYIILDISINKVVGYSCGESETAHLAIEAFQDLFTTNSHLPSYLKLDRSSAHTSNDFKKFLSKASLPEFQMQHKFCKSAREKGTVENFFHWFPEKICSRHKDYVGLGIQTTEKKMNPDKLKQILNKKSLLSKAQLLKLVPTLIVEWNKRPNSKTGISPNELEKRLEIGQAKFLKPEQIAFLIWEEVKKTSLFKARIQIERNKEVFKYRVNDKNLILSISQNQNFHYSVYWNINSPELIHLYQDNKYLGYAKRKEKYLDDPVNITDSDHHHMLNEAKDNQSLLSFINKSLKEDIDKLRELEFKSIPLNGSSGLEPNKKLLEQSEIEFFHRNNIDAHKITPTERNSNNPHKIDTESFLDNYPKHKKKKKNYSNITIEDHDRI